MDVCQVLKCENKAASRGRCQTHAAKVRKGLTFKMKPGERLQPPIIAADKRRCQAFMSNGTQCPRAKEGARKLCRAHDKEMSDRRAMDLRADLEILPREPWVYEGDEESLARMCGQ